MSLEFNGVVRAGAQANQFALVVYIRGPLGGFLDDLRLELVRGCRPRAHMTILPPRKLADVPSAMQQAQAMAADFAPFDFEAGEVEVFPRTNVIYIEIRRHSEQLRAMHDAMNTGALQFDEPFHYHPHITLAQEFDPVETERLVGLARQRWREYDGPRVIRAESVAFVENRNGDCWQDLAVFELGAMSPIYK